ncbi:MAG TPA: 30S ribosomal protein S16 [Fimbriimonadales bacterium]|nr:30S ribosomal protein S16 [Fimbriimonadales bacterium]
MVRIRLMRFGAKAKPYYRVVVIKSTEQRNGRAIEHIGLYNPLKDPYEFRVDKERVIHWLRAGAQASETIQKLLERESIWQEFQATKTKKPRKKPKVPRKKEAAIA